jgi:hypothetical protein
LGLPAGSVLVGNDLGQAEMVIDATLKLGLGVTISKISKHQVSTPHPGQWARSVVVYQIQFEPSRPESTISEEAIKFLSDEKLSDSRERYWLPCGRDQFHGLNISSKSEYPWIQPLTKFFQFFDSGIVLRATSKLLSDDLPVLIKELKKHKPSSSESAIESELKAFYEKFPFESRPEDRRFL